jgi:hypothetical protein
MVVHLITSPTGQIDHQLSLRTGCWLPTYQNAENDLKTDRDFSYLDFRIQRGEPARWRCLEQCSHPRSAGKPRHAPIRGHRNDAAVSTGRGAGAAGINPLFGFFAVNIPTLCHFSIEIRGKGLSIGVADWLGR